MGLHQRGGAFSNFCGRGSRLRCGVIRELRRHRGLRPRPGVMGSLRRADLKAHARSMEELPCKEGTSVEWPRRGYRGLYRHGGALPNQGLWGEAESLVGPGNHGAFDPCVARPVSEVPDRLTLGRIQSTETGAECDIDHRRSHIRRQDKISSISRYDAPQGRQLEAGGDFHQRLLSLSKGIYSFTPYSSHTHRRWGTHHR
jgi:hypothetical protein